LDSYLIYLLTRIILLLFRVVPRRLGRAILNGLAAIAYKFDATHRHIAEVNLAIAFPELDQSERRRIARRSFQNVAQNILEVAKLRSLDKDRISSLVQYHPECGLNNFEAAQRLGKPILYLTGHFSAWELLPAAHALYGHPLSFVTRPLDSVPLEKFLTRVRQSCGNVVISKKNAVRHILECLKRGESVGILMDQNTITLEGEFIDFFGLPAPTTTGLALLALRTGATVLPGYLTSVRQDKYWIKFLPPLELIRTGDMDRDVLENTRMFNQVLERIVRDQPESWLWGHKRWKYQPAENPQNLYNLASDELRRFLAERRIRKSNE